MAATISFTRLPWLLVMLLFASLRVDGATITWTNIDGGAWNEPANWNPNQVPDASDTVFITAAGTYTVTLDANPTIAALELGGSSGQQTLAANGRSVILTGASKINPNGRWEQTAGSLRSDTLLTISGAYLWSGGLFIGTQSVAAGGLVAMESGHPELQGTITNAGTVRWSSGTFYLEFGSTFYNLPGGLFEAQSPDSIVPYSTGPNRFLNEGTFRKTTNNTTSVDAEFTNTGVVEVRKGTLRFPGGFSSSGNFDVAEDATLRLQGGTFILVPGHTFTGEGFYGIVDGVVTLNGDLTATNFQFNGGSLTGTNRWMGTLHWRAGVLRGMHTVAAGGLLKMESGTTELEGTITNAGTVRWNSSAFYLEFGSTFYNAPGGVFEAHFADNFYSYGSGPNRFINEGILRKTGDNITSVGVEFTNAGVVEVQAGTLQFPVGFASSGDFDIALGATVRLQNGTFIFDPGHTFTGEGFYGIAGGTVTIIGDLTATNFQFNGGTLIGTNRLTGTMQWRGGLLSGALTVEAGALLNMESSSPELQGAITNAGTARWSGSTFYLEYGSTFHNLPGALFEARASGTLYSYETGPNRFLNEGTFRKSTENTISVTVEFTNIGALEMQAGPLQFPAGFVQPAGSTLLNGGTLSAGGPILIHGGSLGGTGTISASIDNSGEFNPGLGRGLLIISGNYTQSVTGVLNIELAGITTDTFDRLAVSGTAELHGVLNTILTNGFAPPTNSTFPFLTAGVRTGTFDRHNYASNQVELQIDYAASSATLQVINVFTNVSQFPPVLAEIPDQSVNELSLLQLTATATDADVPTNTLTFRLDAGPAGASIDPVTGVFSWTPTEPQGPGTYEVIVRVTDNGSLFDTETFSVTVAEMNQAPSLALIPSQLIAAGSTLAFTATATDADLPAQALTFSLGPGAPAGASINASSGEFTWAVPANEPAGTVNVTVRVIDDATNALSASQVVAILIDRDGPRVIAMAPSNAVSNVVAHIDVTFDTAIDTATFTVSDIDFSSASGPVATSISLLVSNTYRINFASLAPGDYTLKIGPNVTDLAGNPMNQDGDGINGEAVQDLFTGDLFLRLSDLVVTDILSPTDAVIGQPLELVWVVRNQGNATAVGPWYDYISLVENVSGENAVGLTAFHFTNSIPPGEFIARTQSVILPSYVFGQRFVSIHADFYNFVAEGANETNNTAVNGTPIQILAPDLVLTSLEVPSTAQFGQPVQIVWSVVNAGNGPALANWNDGLYLTPDSGSLSGGSYLAAPAIHAAPLAAGASYTRTQTVTFPVNSLAPGDYFITFVADLYGGQPESNELNNIASEPINLVTPPLPDLVVTNILAPANALPGDSVALIWAVTNQGTLAVTGSWTETISFSNSPPLAAFTFSNALAVGASITRTQIVVIPPNDAAGNLHLVVEVDSGHDVDEASEGNNVAVAAQATAVPATLTLSLSRDEIHEDAANPIINATVTRNGDRSNPLLVSLSSSDITELTLPSTVTVPVGQVTAAFSVTVQHDGVVDGSQLVGLAAGAEGFTGATGLVTVIDVDLPRLTVAFAASSVGEGSNINVTVTRDLITTQALVVTLTSSDASQFGVPATVTIPADQSFAVFAAQAVNDTLIEADRTYTVTASANEFISGSASIDIVDDDIPQLTVNIAAPDISEGAGAVATSGTVTRDSIGPRALVVALESFNLNAARVPSSVTIPAAAMSATFPIAAVNNEIVDGTKSATIQAYVTDTQTGARIAAATPDTISVLDDDGPTLRLVIDRDLVAEGRNPAATATLSRNAGTTLALAVDVVSGDTSEATVPALVTIPANQTSVTFPVASINDGATDGDQSVTVTASANGFVSGSATVVVTDRDLPDLVVSAVTIPATGATDGFFDGSFRVANQGVVASTNPIVQRVFLSTDAVIGDDVLIDQTTFTPSLAPEAHFTQTLRLRLPNITGDYWIVVATDAGEAVAETLENNNAAISAQPIRVEKTYGATVETDVSVALAGTPVPLHGRATLVGGNQPAAFSLVNVHLEVRETKRVFSALTDQNGNYNIVFQPLPGEAGTYQVGADHPGVSSTPSQDTFTLIGVRLTPPGGVLKLIEASQLTGLVKMENLSDLALNNLTATVIEKPANWQVTLNLTNDTLAGSAEGFLGFTITASDLSTLQAIVLIRVTNPEGVTADVRLPVQIELLRPRLVADPGSLVVGMKRGDQTTVQFKVMNSGGAPSGELDILPPAIPWLMVASGGQMPSLAPGETNSITLILTPPADLALGDHQGSIFVSGTGAGLPVPFTFRALSTAAGDLRISAVDEYTYYAEGSPPLTNAAVTITDELSGTVVHTNVTDTRGELLISNLTEAYYRVDVRAEGHGNFRSTTLVAAGKTNELLAFLPRETVRYIWTVVPTEIEDRTRFVIETVFETVVPIPVVTVEPMLIELENFQGTVTQVNLKISNEGLVNADNTRLTFEESEEISVTALITNIGVLRAKSSITVPVIIRRLAPGLAGPAKRLAKVAKSGGGCDLRGAALWDLVCGPVTRGNGVPIMLKNAGSGCGGSGGAGFAGFTGFNGFFGGAGGGGAAMEGGGTGSYIGPSEVRPVGGPCDPCVIAVLSLGKSVLFPSGGGNCVKNMLGCLGGVRNPGFKPAVDCTKAAISCVKSIGEAVGESAVPVFKSIDILSKINNVANSCGGAGLTAPAKAKAFGSLAKAAVSHPELERLNKNLVRLQTLVDVETHLFGDTAWFNDSPMFLANWLAVFLPATETNSFEGEKISAAEEATLLATPLPPSVTVSNAQRFISRWNQTLDYWAAGTFDSTNVPPGQNTNFIAFDALQTRLESFTNALAAAEAEGFTDLSEAADDARQELVRLLDRNSGGDCATVRLKIEQEAVITRDAFNASLEVINSTAGSLDQVSVELIVRNENGELTTSLFAIRTPTLSGLTGVNGTGVIAPNSSGKANWIIIPTSEAAPAGPIIMAVSGTLRYRQDGVQVSVPLAPASITVLPNASLNVKYFHQRDVFSDDPFTQEVEPSIPFSLGVMIQNNGKGAARNVRLTSAQPKIVDNDKGLLVDFRILATEVAGQNLSPSLTANFGNIEPDGIAVGRWLFVSSLQGLFVDYKASFEHLDSLGDPRLSLVDSVEIHELNHLVRADRTFEDGRPDFLVNDVPDLNDMPDTLHLSDGRVEPVALITQGSTDGGPSSGDLEVILTAGMPAGWAYLRIPDPGNGQFQLTRVRRADGSDVPFDFNVWTTDRTFIGNSQQPVLENILHLLDYNGSGPYTLTYGAPPAVDTTPPVSAVETLPAASSAQIPVRWSATDEAGGSGVGFFDIFVSVNGGVFTPWLERTMLSGALYTAAQNDHVAFYSIATDHAGNKEAPPGTPDAQTSITVSNHAPSLALLEPITVDEGNLLVIENNVSDPDATDGFTFGLLPGGPSGAIIDSASGLITWTTGEGNGPSTNIITVRVTDNGVPSLSATSSVQVIVREVNQPPDVTLISNRIASEGNLLTFAVNATDSDLPANQVTFALGGGAPSGAAITSAGIFSWTPSPLQGPSTNQLSIIATDNGTPPLSSTQHFTVTVRDSLGDFTVSMGSTNIHTGQTSSVPVLLSSGDLTNFAFTVTVAGAGLENFALLPLAPEIASVSVGATGPDSFTIQFATLGGEVLQGNDRIVAQLIFEAAPAAISAMVPLRISDLAGERSTGAPLNNGVGRDGRVVVIGRQPILETLSLPFHALLLYGNPGTNYEIQTTSDLTGGNWQPASSISLSNSFQTIGLTNPPTPPYFLRAIER